MLVVATSVSSGVGVVDLGSGVERLMHIAYVVDNEAEGKRFLVLLRVEMLCNQLVVLRVLVVSLIEKEVGKVSKSSYVVDIIRLEFGVVSESFALLNDCLILEVPV